MSPDLILDIKTIAITAVVAYGATEVLKPLMKASNKRKSLIRALALIVGGLVGFRIYPELGGKSNIVGCSLGVCAGALNALIVALIKKKIQNKVEEEKT
jgi:energy-converting hydrogenase Eha subunit A